jgi:adenylate kinase
MFIRLLFLLLCVASNIDAQHFFLMGSPGSGKGVTTKYLQEQGSYRHLCLGDLLRREIELGNPNGMLIDTIIKAGELVPNELMFSLFEEHFSTALLNHESVIIDGLVQSQDNVDFFDTLLIKYDLEHDFTYIYLNVTKEVALERLLGRLMCGDCDSIYDAKSNLKNCTLCQGLLVKRIDDTNETILKRINRFFGKTIHLVDHYRSKPDFIELDGNLDKEELYLLLSQLVNGRN